MNADAVQQAIDALTPEQRADWRALWKNHAKSAHPDLNFDEWLRLVTASALRAAERRMAQPHRRREI